MTLRLPKRVVEVALPETTRAELEAVPVVTKEVVVAEVVVELVTIMPVPALGWSETLSEEVAHLDWVIEDMAREDPPTHVPSIEKHPSDKSMPPLE